MKAEDVARLYGESGELNWSDLAHVEQMQLERFASAIESHVRAEAFCDQRFRYTDHEPCACCPEHWSAVDATMTGGSDG